MKKTLSDVRSKIQEIELKMSDGSFWDNKDEAQKVLADYQNLKKEEGNLLKYDAGSANINIFAGAGGDDAEDFVRMLANMYSKYASSKGFEYFITDENKTSTGGYRSISIEIKGKSNGFGAYGLLKNESGVHRLVRLSPFNSGHTRETSFAMVEVLPVLENSIFNIPAKDIEFEFTKSSGPGGQNVNKRETAVRATHIPTGLTVHVSEERSQEQNRQKAIVFLEGKIFKQMEKLHAEKIDDLSVSKQLDNEWGSQMRSYTLHPYKLIKDHRTGVESTNPEAVLVNGELDNFIEEELKL